LLRVNNLPAPKDFLLAQCAIHFAWRRRCTAIQIDPRSFNRATARNPQVHVLDLRAKMSLSPPSDDHDHRHLDK
jgi:hypothetical protein